MGLCKATIKKTGLKCLNKEKEGGYCGVHRSKTLKPTKTTTEAFDEFIDSINKLKIKEYKNSLVRPTKRKSL